MTNARLSIEEVNFSRLLRKTEQELTSYNEGKIPLSLDQREKKDTDDEPEFGLGNTYALRVGSAEPNAFCQQLFERSLITLVSQWHHLAATDAVEETGKLKRLHGGPPPSQMSLAAYKNKIDNLLQVYANILTKEKAEYAQQHPEFSRSSRRSSTSSLFPTHSYSSDPNRTSSISQVLTEKEQLFSSMKDGSEVDEASLSVEELIKKHRAMQEQLTEEILLIVSALKETSIQSLNIVKEDNSRLETVEQEVADNIELITSENRELKKQKSRSGLISSMLWSAIFVAFVSFFAMYYVIRFSGGRILL